MKPFLAFLAVLCHLAVVRSQPDARRIINECIAATQSLSSYRCHVTDSNSYMGFSAFDVTQQRAVVKDIHFGKSLYAYSGYISPDKKEQKPISLVYNGADVRMLDYTDNSVYLFSEPTPKQLGSFTSRLGYPLPFILPFWNPVNLELEFPEISYAGSKTVYDVPCDLIRLGRKVKRPDTGEETILYVNYLIGRQDHLCRGIETERQKTWVQFYETNKAYEFSSFVIAVPANFSEKKVDSYTPPDNRGLLAIGTEAPVFAPAHHANVLPQLKNKLVLLDFWGTWCGPCRLAMPHLQSLYKKYKDRGLEVIGISVADAEGAPEKYMKDNKFSYRLFTKGEAIAKAYQVSVFPTMYLIGKDGKILAAEKGIREQFEADMEKLIEQALK
jgi:thiol-disulfide isomerase/thioredoxin